MSQTKHSPTPWKHTGYQVQDANGEVIILVGVSSRIPHAVAKANAQLTAAAPDLLEACRAAYSALGFPISDESLFQVTNQLANAIAKATDAA